MEILSKKDVNGVLFLMATFSLSLLEILVTFSTVIGEKNNPTFSFLDLWDQHHQYYKTRLNEAKEVGRGFKKYSL